MGTPKPTERELPLYRVIARHNPTFEGVFVDKRWWSSKVWQNDIALDDVAHFRLKSDYRLTVEPMPVAGNQARIDESAIKTAEELNKLRAEHEQLQAEHQKLGGIFETTKAQLTTLERDSKLAAATTIGQAKEEADLLRASLEVERTTHDSLKKQHEEVEEELRVTKKRLAKYEDETGELRDQVSVVPTNGPPEDPTDAPKGGKKGR